MTRVDFYSYLAVIKTELKENWKPAVAMVGIAIVVTAVWGKVAVFGFGLVAFGGYVAFGPSIKVMTFLDMKGFLIIGALAGNGYFGLINPMLLNYYAAACMLVREWNFWDIHAKLSSHKDDLIKLNGRMSEAGRNWEEKIGKLEVQFRSLVKEGEEAVASQRKLNGQISGVQNPIDRNLQEIEQRLSYLHEMATIIVNDETLKARAQTAAQVEADFQEATTKHVALQVQYQKMTTQLQNLNQGLEEALEKLGGLELLKTEQLQVLTDVIEKLKKLGR